uniref:Uncharacterized protein n=1 Tax=Romanomermis culicivorax TaxID=13658 RepID=A0A915J0R5_ROMCU
MNRFLSQLDITFRRDPNNYRPRINKLNSVKIYPAPNFPTPDSRVWSYLPGSNGVNGQPRNLIYERSVDARNFTLP